MSAATINFDFGKHWNSLVAPFLTSSTIKELLKQAHHEWKVNRGLLHHEFSEKCPPACLMSTIDWYHNTIDEIIDAAVEQKDPRISKELLKSYNHAWRNWVRSEKPNSSLD